MTVSAKCSSCNHVETSHYRTRPRRCKTCVCQKFKNVVAHVGGSAVRKPVARKPVSDAILEQTKRKLMDTASDLEHLGKPRGAKIVMLFIDRSDLDSKGSLQNVAEHLAKVEESLAEHFKDGYRIHTVSIADSMLIYTLTNH